MRRKTISITLPECKAFAARMLNSIRISEGHPTYTAEQIDTWWNELQPTERVEWEDSALADKMERADMMRAEEDDAMPFAR